MKKVRALFFLPGALLTLWAGPAASQTLITNSPSGLALEEPRADRPNRLGVSYRMGFNSSVKFKNIGGFFSGGGHNVPGFGFQAANTGVGTGRQQNRTYDDGYVWVDNNNNTHLGEPLTWFWGYDNASQATEKPGYILMHASSSSGGGESHAELDEPLSGVELNYQRELVRKEHWQFGLEAAIGYAPVDVSDNRPLSSSVTVTEDAYALPLFNGSPITPLPPSLQQGTYQGPGDLLSDNPIRSVTTIANGAGVVGQRDFKADIFSFRVGPYLEVPLSDKFSVSLSGGLALAYIASDFSFFEAVSISGTGSQAREGSSSHSDWQVGGYVAGTLSVALSDRWTAYAGAQFQTLGTYTQKASGKSVVMDLRDSVFVTVGLSYAF